MSYRSHEATWIGGASAPSPVTTSAGYRSFSAFWLGGAGMFTFTPPLPVPAGRRSGMIIVKDYGDPLRDKRRREDDEILILGRKRI